MKYIITESQLNKMYNSYLNHVFKGLHEKEISGATFDTLIFFVVLFEYPSSSTIVSLTGKTPPFPYVWLGLASSLVFPSPKSQIWEIIFPSVSIDESVKIIVSLVEGFRGEYEKCASGGVFVIVIVLLD